MNDPIRSAFQKYRDERNAALETEGHKPGSKWHIDNTHYATWQAALGAKGGESEPFAYFTNSCGADCFTRDKQMGEVGWPSIGGTFVIKLYTHPTPPSVAVPEFLFEMSKQMRQQPNRMTSHPFWQVRYKDYLPTLEGYNQHHTEICGDDGVIYSSEQPLSEFHDYLIENHEDWCKEWVGDYHDDEDDWKEAIKCYYDIESYDDLPDGLRKIPVQEIEQIASTHFTQADAEWFIRRKQHDYPKLYTYVESAYWSPQMKELQDWIISLTAAHASGHIGDAEKVLKDFIADQQPLGAEFEAVYDENKEGLYEFDDDHIDAARKVVPDSEFSDEFVKWWDDHGQFVRAGGGNYERTFAFEAWRHLYPRIATPSVPEVEIKARALEEFAKDCGLLESQFDDQGYIEIPRWRLKEHIARLRTASDDKKEKTDGQ